MTGIFIAKSLLSNFEKDLEVDNYDFHLELCFFGQGEAKRVFEWNRFSVSRVMMSLICKY